MAEKKELETTIKNLKRVLDPLKEKVQRCKHFHQDAAKLKVICLCVCVCVCVGVGVGVSELELKVKDLT